MTQLASGDPITPSTVDTPSEDASVQRGLHATYDYTGQKEIPNQQIAAVFQSVFENSDRYRNRFMPELIKAYMQYHGDAEDRGKAEWQSNVNMPNPYAAVSTSTARIIDAMFSNENYFDINPFTRVDDAKVAFAKNVVRWNVDRADGRAKIGTSISDALVCGWGPMKVYYREWLEERTEVEKQIIPQTPDDNSSWFAKTMTNVFGPQYTTTSSFVTRNYYSSKLCLDPILPTDIWLDPSGRGEFIIQLVRRRVSDLWDLCRNQKDASGQVRIPAVYDEAEVRKITNTQRDPTQEARAAVIRRDSPHLYEDDSVDVYEFWGDLRDPSNGVVLFKNCLITLVNRMYVIRRPETNPYRHRKFPFIIFTAADLPHQVYPYGLLKQGSQLQDAVNRHWNITLDKAMLSLPQFEVNLGAAKNADELMGSNASFKIGKFWYRKNGTQPDAKIFNPIEASEPVSPQDLQLLKELESRTFASYGLSEFNSTQMPQTGDRKTKDEAVAKTQAGQAVFNATATHIEKNALSPLLKMVYDLTLQFEDRYSDETLTRMVGESPEALQLLQATREMTMEERWDQLYLDAEFRCVGITNAISKADMMNRVMAFMKIVGGSPVLGALADMRVAMRMILQSLTLPKEMLVDNADQIIGMLQQAQIQQLTNPQPQQQPAQAQGMPGQNQHNSQEALMSGMQQQGPPQ